MSQDDKDNPLPEIVPERDDFGSRPQRKASSAKKQSHSEPAPAGAMSRVLLSIALIGFFRKLCHFNLQSHRRLIHLFTCG